MRLGTAGQGGAWYGWVRQGTGPGLARLARRGAAGQGKARQGSRRGWAGRGKARQGSARLERGEGQGWAWQGQVRQGMSMARFKENKIIRR